MNHVFAVPSSVGVAGGDVPGSQTVAEPRSALPPSLSLSGAPTQPLPAARCDSLPRSEAP